MEIAKMDVNNYMFLKENDEEFTYKHKFLVEGTETDKLGMEEKWSVWTSLTAREYSLKHKVSIISTKKRS